MATLVYTPGIQIIVSTMNNGLIDLSDDISSGNVVLRENASHTFNVTLNNPNRKYEGIFTPNDRVIIQMKRIKWLQVFAGYLTRVPMYSTYPQPITIAGECGLKIMRNWPWDENSTQAAELKTSAVNSNTGQDGGMSQIIINLLTRVMGWPADHIHIGSVPAEWVDRFKAIYEAIAKDIQTSKDILGANPVIAGSPISPAATDLSNTTPRSNEFPSSTTASGEQAVGDIDIPVVLATIRHMESNNNYQSITNPVNGTASGAYQFIDSTWNNYGGYPRAYLAPPTVQDAKASEMVKDVLNRYGNKLINVPLAWYWPKVFSDPSWMDQIPHDSSGNTWGNKLTLRQYANKWLVAYADSYQQIRGQPYYSSPTSGGSVPGTSDTRVITPGDATQALYPIPIDSKGGLDADKSGWGGYENGKVPASAMKYSKITGSGYPHAVDAWTLLYEDATKAGFDLRGSMYRDYAAQAQGAASSKLFGSAGHSNHGWGLAIDVTELVPGSSNTYHGLNATQMFTSAAYLWLKANAWRYGFSNPPYAQPGGNPDKLEPWHWEFVAFPNFPLTVTGPVPGQGANPFDSTVLNLGLDPGNSALFNALQTWRADMDSIAQNDSSYLTGYRALINDSPVLATVAALTAAAGRSFCMAPNGDFIAWFPDYWDEFGLAGKVNIEMIELQDFSVEWDDQSLITHQYVEGSTYDPGQAFDASPLPSGIRDGYQLQETGGVATVDMPRFLEAVIGKQIDQIAFMADPQQLLDRFGARVSNKSVPSIAGPQQEFWMAVKEFCKHWAEQFNAYIPITFMPELFPGMIMAIPELKIQFYVSTVTHNFDFSNNAGFTTNVGAIAPSGTDGSGFIMFPRGGVQPERNSTFRIIRT